MKVLMIGWELPPFNSGGLGVACYQMCKELVGHGVSIEFILPYSADHAIDFMKITPAIADETINRPFHGAYDSFPLHQDSTLHSAFESSIGPIAKRSDFDIIHAHDWMTFRAAIRAKQISGKPLVVHIHATEYDRSGGNSGNSLVEEIEYMGMMIADKIIAVSEYTKQVITQHYRIPADKVEVVHNSVDIESYEPESAENVYAYLNVLKQHGWRVVSNIGRFTLQKGLTNLLRAMQGVIARAPRTMLLFVGSGDQYEELVELAAELDISANVLFVDFQRGKALRDAFAVSDLFVMPSVSEPFGIAPLEAIAFGTPVLVSKQSGVSEVLRNCLKVDFWDIDEMVNQITAVVLSDALRDELRTQSYDEFLRLSWKQSAHKMRRLYDAQIGIAA